MLAVFSSSNISGRLSANMHTSFPRTFQSPQRKPDWRDSGLAHNLEICNPVKHEGDLRRWGRLHALSDCEI